MKGTKGALMISVLTLIISVALFAGGTFAWFTDAMVSDGNTIKAGTLRADLLEHDGTEYKSVREDGGITYVLSDTESVLYLAVKNVGNLKFEYEVALSVEGGGAQYIIIEEAQNGTSVSWDDSSARPVGGDLTAGELDKEGTAYFALLLKGDAGASVAVKVTAHQPGLTEGGFRDEF